MMGCNCEICQREEAQEKEMQATKRVLAAVEGALAALKGRGLVADLRVAEMGRRLRPRTLAGRLEMLLDLYAPLVETVEGSGVFERDPAQGFIDRATFVELTTKASTEEDR